MGLKETILQADDLKEQTVAIPEWGGVELLVRGLTDEQIGSYQAKSLAMRAKQRQGQDVDMEMEMRHRRSELLVQCLRDPEDSKRVFTDGDAVKLAQKNAGVVNGLFLLAQSLSGMDRDFESQVKDAEKNSATGQS